MQFKIAQIVAARLVGGYLLLDAVEEMDQLMAMALHVLPGFGSVQHVERGE
ncbi:hypothetical protein ACSMXM_05100 [Pacificimonas sp. ICDLI1SI03]